MAAAAAAAGSASAVSRPARPPGGAARDLATPARPARGTARGASAVSSGRSPSDAVSLPPSTRPVRGRGPELRAAPELWTHRLTASEIAGSTLRWRARAPPTWT